MDLFIHDQLVDQVRDLLDRDLVLALRHVFDDDLGTDDDGSPAGLVSLANAGSSDDIAAGWEVRSGNLFHQFDRCNVRIIHDGDDAVDRFTQIVCRHVGCHTDSNTHRPVDQKVREAAGQSDRFLVSGIVVVAPVDRLFFDILQKLERDLGHARFGITHGGCAVSIQGTEVSVTVNQWVTVGERLRHSDHRIVDRRIAVRVIFTHNFTDDVGGLDMRFIRKEAGIIHCPQDSAVYRFHAVANIREGAVDDDGHGVAQEVFSHFRRDVDFLHVSVIEKSVI